MYDETGIRSEVSDELQSVDACNGRTRHRSEATQRSTHKTTAANPGQVRTSYAGLEKPRLDEPTSNHKNGDRKLVKLTKKNVFKAYGAGPETAMDKTTRVVRKMVDEDAEKRQEKMTRLRKARLEREANTPTETTAKSTRKTR